MNATFRVFPCHRSLCFVLVGVALLGAAQANVDPKKGRVTANPTSGNRYTIEQEIQIGQKGVSEIERELKLLPPGHPMSRYISSLGQKLAAKARQTDRLIERLDVVEKALQRNA